MGLLKKTRTPEARKRRVELVVIGIVAILILGLTIAETQFPRLAGSISSTNHILIFTLININILLILLLIFLVIRNLVKLVFERRRNVLGAKIRTKLVVAFISLSLVPTILLFFVAVGFITSSVEQWFKPQVVESLQSSLEVAQSYYRDFAEGTVSAAQDISRYLSTHGLAPQGKGMAVTQDELERKRREYRLSLLGVFWKETGESLTVADPNLKNIFFTHPKDFLAAGFAGQTVSRRLPAGEGEVITGLSPLAEAKGGKILGVVSASHFVPRSMTVKMRQISQAYVDYKQLKILRKPIKSSYKMALLMVTLLILFSATWFGFHLAKDITVPIKELAEATHRIASGDLNYRIEMKAADEIGLLVQSFNQMTEDLQVSRLELEQRRKYMEIVLKNVAAGVVSLDQKRRVTTVNTSAEKMLGISAERVLEKPYEEAFPSEVQAWMAPLLEELTSSGKDFLTRQLVLDLGGKSLALLINITHLKDEEGNPLGIVIVFDDLTQLMKAQRMAAWREVARRIAHEIKNPLTPIQLSAQRLRKRYLERLRGDGEVFDECTQTIVKQVEELKAMVNEFSNFARMPASNPTPNHLNEIVQEALVLFREAHRDVRFEFSAGTDLPVFNLDRDQMKRVLLNLIKNSLAAIDPGGEIRIQTSYDPHLQIVRLEVSDNGCGIRDEDKSRLFEPYFSTRKSGTGLGLTIVNAIVSDHNGYIRVRDNKPKGTTFVIELPVRV